MPQHNCLVGVNTKSWNPSTDNLATKPYNHSSSFFPIPHWGANAHTCSIAGEKVLHQVWFLWNRFEKTEGAIRCQETRFGLAYNPRGWHLHLSETLCINTINYSALHGVFTLLTPILPFGQGTIPEKFGFFPAQFLTCPGGHTELGLNWVVSKCFGFNLTSIISSTIGGAGQDWPLGSRNKEVTGTVRQVINVMPWTSPLHLYKPYGPLSFPLFFPRSANTESLPSARSSTHASAFISSEMARDPLEPLR